MQLKWNKGTRHAYHQKKGENYSLVICASYFSNHATRKMLYIFFYLGTLGSAFKNIWGRTNPRAAYQKSIRHMQRLAVVIDNVIFWKFLPHLECCAVTQFLESVTSLEIFFSRQTKKVTIKSNIFQKMKVKS